MVYCTELKGREGRQARATVQRLYGLAEAGDYDGVVSGVDRVRQLSRRLPQEQQQAELTMLVGDLWQCALAHADGDRKSPHNQILDYLQRFEPLH